MVTAPGRSLIEDHFAPDPELEAALKARGKEAELKALRDDFPNPEKISFTHQEQPLGLGHAVWCAKEFVSDGPFAVLLPDDLMQARPGCLAQMVEAYQDTGGNVIAVEEVAVERTARYGVLDVEDDDGRLARARGVVEKPDPAEAPSRLAVIGRYILQPQVFDHLDKQVEGAGGEIQLTDAISKLFDTQKVFAYEFPGVHFDVGTPVGLLKASVYSALNRGQAPTEFREWLAELL